MGPRLIAPKVLSWASVLDEQTAAQAATAARLPVVHGHVALMPDAHLGKGATVGSVIPTRDALIPSAVGVDIGCGMTAAETDLYAADLPDDLEPLLARIERSVPAGMGRGHKSRDAGLAWLRQAPCQPRPRSRPSRNDGSASSSGRSARATTSSSCASTSASGSGSSCTAVRAASATSSPNVTSPPRRG